VTNQFLGEGVEAASRKKISSGLRSFSDRSFDIVIRRRCSDGVRRDVTSKKQEVDDVLIAVSGELENRYPSDHAKLIGSDHAEQLEQVT
jgi:hypothetical protein